MGWSTTTERAALSPAQRDRRVRQRLDLSAQVALPAEGVGTRSLQRSRGRTRLDRDGRRLPRCPERRRARFPRCHGCSPAGHAVRVREVGSRRPHRPLHGARRGAPRTRRSPRRTRRSLAAAHGHRVLAPPDSALRGHPSAPASRCLRVVDDNRRRGMVALCVRESSRQPAPCDGGCAHRSEARDMTSGSASPTMPAARRRNSAPPRRAGRDRAPLGRSTVTPVRSTRPVTTEAPRETAAAHRLTARRRGRPARRSVRCSSPSTPSRRHPPFEATREHLCVPSSRCTAEARRSRSE